MNANLSAVVRDLEVGIDSANRLEMAFINSHGDNETKKMSAEAKFPRRFVLIVIGSAIHIWEHQIVLKSNSRSGYRCKRRIVGTKEFASHTEAMQHARELTANNSYHCYAEAP